jgi:hypothetical protein
MTTRRQAELANAARRSAALAAALLWRALLDALLERVAKAYHHGADYAGFVRPM